MKQVSMDLYFMKAIKVFQNWNLRIRLKVLKLKELKKNIDTTKQKKLMNKIKSIYTIKVNLTIR